MDSFSTGSSGTGPPQFSTDEFMDQMKTVRGKCFEKCITKPGSSLSGSESSCISRCVDRYIEATGIAGRALFSSC
ncbi:Mitochondrial import inner membrane translocase subunit Tim13 [Hibiscus syriacus]|uniref:Mitochondrial import inner membrane translocase subunit n=1 Tax=Hibiscus syriacus TaxID=106335 RepID=A0A6A3BCI0_HIBSY|nr:Mitochondrial import inner membrane translocase subunit Tim13 [Hibiscus syriacus]